jgi:hypothetical protein
MLTSVHRKLQLSALTIASVTTAVLGAGTAWAQTSPASPSASAAAAAPGCTAVAFPPTTNGVNILGRTSASCRGPVHDVVVTDDLYQLHITWIVANSRSTKWGSVPVSRYGYRDAWWNPGIGACYGYINRGRVTWRFANGNPGSSINYSRRANLRLHGGGC